MGLGLPLLLEFLHIQTHVDPRNGEHCPLLNEWPRRTHHPFAVNHSEAPTDGKERRIVTNSR